MADWLKKQAEREAEKEQQRAERLQRKLREPEHRFSDPLFQQQCHQLAERLEDSVIKGGRHPRPLLPGPPPTASNRLSWCFRSAGVLQRTGEGRTRLRFKGTQEPEQRAAGQEEEDGPVLVGGGGWVQTNRLFTHNPLNCTKTFFLQVFDFGSNVLWLDPSPWLQDRTGGAAEFRGRGGR